MTIHMAGSMMSVLLVTVGDSDDEHIFLGAHAAHLCEHLVDDPVSCVSNVSSMRLGYRVQLVHKKKQDTGSCSPGLVKHIPHVSLTLSRPPSQSCLFAISSF